MEKQCRPFAPDEVEIFVKVKLAKPEDIEALYSDLSKHCWVLKAIPKYANVFKLQVDKRVQIMILTITEGIIGKAVKCLVMIKEWADKHDQRDIDLDTFTMRIFPHGFPDFSNGSANENRI